MYTSNFKPFLPSLTNTEVPWSACRLKALVHRLFVQQLVQANKKWDTKSTALLILWDWNPPVTNEQQQKIMILSSFSEYLPTFTPPPPTLRWRHNGRDRVSDHQPHDCLLNRLFRRRSKITSKLRITSLSVGNSPGTGEFPAQMASYAENVSIWWRHHEIWLVKSCLTFAVWVTRRG